MTKRTAQFWLGGLWVGGAVLLAVIMSLQTMMSSALQGYEQDLWKWLSAALLPNVTLMLGVIGAQAFGAKVSVNASRSLFTMAMVTSVTYLIFIGIVIALI